MIRHSTVLVVCFLLSIALNVYINSYSLHSFIYADYKTFDTPPDDNGLVQIDGEAIDFRLPRLTLDKASQQTIRDELSATGDADDDFQTVVRLVEYVRNRLNGVDKNLPRIDDRNADEILELGMQRYCLCSEYARLFMEATQVLGLQSRILWLEGHVADEYFDRQQKTWVYVDPQLGVVVNDDAGRHLSVSTTIARIERNEPVDFTIISRAGEKAIDFEEFATSHPSWYRNILLNGETRAYSGPTLVEPGRWQVLLRQRTFPQILVLRSTFDISHGTHIDPLSPKKIVACFLLIWVAFYGMYFLISSRRGRAMTKKKDGSPNG